MDTLDDLAKSIQIAIQDANLICTRFNTSLKAAILTYVEHQESIARVMSLLPGKYTYEQVETALIRAGIHPDHLYLALSVAHLSAVLTRFYEAMEG